MKLKLLIVLSFLTCSVIAQIRFEKGYYISNSGTQVDGLIKNVDWENNPKEFEFKSDESSEIEFKSVNNVKEFGIENEFKFVRFTVDMDRSRENIADYSHSKNPEFSKETVFLKELLQGDVSLYIYQETNFHRYFYQIENENPVQLIYKKYYINSSDIATNNQFRNQIFKNFRCEGISKSTIEKLEYQKKDLMDYFISYSDCKNGTTTVIENKKSSSDFNLGAKIGANFSSLEVYNSIIPTSKNTIFDNKTTLSFGLELEYIFPFNKNKWAVIAEPNYRSYKAEGKSTKSEKISEIKYNSIELPVGVRHYFILGKKSKIFINALFVWDSVLNSEFVFQENKKLDVKSQSNYAFGVGYNYDRYSVEFRYYTKRKILSDYTLWISDFQNFNLTLGYKIF